MSIDTRILFASRCFNY